MGTQDAGGAAPATDVQVASSAATQDNGATSASPAEPSSGSTEGGSAGSPTASEVVKPASPLEAVKAALKVQGQPNSESVEQSASDSTNRDGANGKGTSGEADDVSDEEITKHLSEKANRRFRQLTAERDTARNEVAQYKGEAEAYRTIVERVAATGATAQQVDGAVELLGAINNDPARAFQMLEPLYRQLAEFVGASLPSDLQEKVNGGYIDEASAREMARLRNTQNFAQRVNERNTRTANEIASQRSAEEATANLRSAVESASGDWETQWKQNDPDYERKLPFVLSEIKALIAEAGGVQSPQQAVSIANTAIKNINSRMETLLPARREIKTVTGGFSSGNERSAPKTALEAAGAALMRR